MPVGTHKPEPAVDILHGLKVVDPYRWLEDRTSEETDGWLSEQARIHELYFSKLPLLNTVRSRVSEYLNVEILDQPAQVGSYTFFRRRRKDQEQACICVRDIDSGTERVLVDPSKQGLHAAVRIHRISEDGRLLAYSLKQGGERTEELHFVDVVNERTLEDCREAGLSRGLSFASDNLGFYYCREFTSCDSLNRPHEILYHRFGDSACLDRVLFSLPTTERSRLVLVADDVNLGAIFVHDRGDGPKLDLYIAARIEVSLWRPVVQDKPAHFGPFLYAGKIFAICTGDSPNGCILELNLDGSNRSLLVPPWRAPIANLCLAKGRLYISYQLDCKTIIHAWTWTGTFLGALPDHPDGSFGMLRSYTHATDVLFFSHESFCDPPSIYLYRENTRSYVRWSQSPPVGEGHRYAIQRTTYPSRDGTSIPIWLVALHPFAADKCYPVLLTAYGGFGISMTPRFSVLVSVMLELGCVFALPSIRGGSEFGNQWHEAARGRRRQVAFDDFLAAAEWLRGTGLTKPEYLAIFGGSNSGLLVAAAMTQRPELFRAVLCLAPILDMVRYERFGDARKWREEYGSVEDADDFRALYAYSPYHRIREEINYPAALFITGDKDTQCDPAHSRKMTARLRDRVSQTKPILIDYGPERGHSAVLPLSERIDALARRIAFLCNELNIDFPMEAIQ
jgi:prolyl oligopeptidase